jgi:hypothetical protein
MERTGIEPVTSGLQSRRQTLRALELLRGLEGAPRPSWRLAPGPGYDIFFQPDRACPKSCNRLWEVRPLRIARRGALGDTEQLGHFSEAYELQRHVTNRKSWVGLPPLSRVLSIEWV